MPIISDHFNISTKGYTDIVDITEHVQGIVSQHQLEQAQALVYVAGSTASITTIEYEPGLLKDLPEVLEKIAPVSKMYHHDDTWHDGNGSAHVRASIIGNSETFPIVKSALMLGPWQQIVLIDFDNKRRTRNVIVQITH